MFDVSAFDTLYAKLMEASHQAWISLTVMAARMTPGERVVMLAVFGLIVMAFMIRPANRKRVKKRNQNLQFFFALIVVSALGFGAGWIFDVRTIRI
ncbi:MAG: hypothetical protein AAFQ21_06015 [Pseudomonadota bacterium]